ncbi:GNAT family N-acetyltransferase [Dermatobacter hominis]|uniref:GNAT family N-acetyltransferase n=1 Tax=Dermatobacter hominis TaxID=2884263 RepID=UPI001D1123CE|nr:GNAT family N-acetyltransferase [Dermatobacter hominis]UDY36374.1 GNAT family N-acetyltransferase [Dermatobacter hominis]
MRDATPADRPELVRLAARALEHLDTQKGGAVFRDREARPVPVDGTVDADLAAAAEGRAIVLLGCLGPVPVGYAVARVEPTRGAPLAVVQDLYVEPEARRVGVGRALMAALVRRAEEDGCGGIQAEALPGDRATKNFFEGFGLVARKITVHRPLGGAVDEEGPVDGRGGG